MKIESNIPIPQKKSVSKFPFGEMKVGDSFLAPQGAHISGSVGYYKLLNPGKNFKTRKTAEGIRVWRTA